MALSTPVVSAATSPFRLSSEEMTAFQRDGYLILRGLVPPATVETMLSVTRDDLARATAPVEFEAEVAYPGSPASLDAEGGRTIRRLKQALTRDPVFADFIAQPAIAGRLQQMFNGQRVYLPMSHHNCVMTKQPRFSSDTLWHQDIRYWAFARPDLISLWVALGHERPENGCLWVIPGTHRLSYRPEQFDEQLFFRTDLPENQIFIEQKIPVELAPGDVLFFHCRTFHAASKNFTQETKFSAVFTFRPEDNPPIPGSRSAAAAEILLPDCSVPTP